MKTIADVVMIEDDRGRLDEFVGYCRDRGDIEPHVSQFSTELWNLGNLAKKASLIDLILLDVRLPGLPAHMTVPPDKLPPRGVQLAMDLGREDATASIPVIVYTLYANNPVIRMFLDRLEDKHNYPNNVVSIFRKRPSMRDIISVGLASIRNIAINVSRLAGHTAAYTLQPTTTVTQNDLVNACILLNGHSPECVNRCHDSANIWVGFGEKALQELDYNYLMVQIGSKKSIYRV
jgi:hypothetical protein